MIGLTLMFIVQVVIFILATVVSIYHLIKAIQYKHKQNIIWFSITTIAILLFDLGLVLQVFGI